MKTFLKTIRIFVTFVVLFSVVIFLSSRLGHYTILVFPAFVTILVLLSIAETKPEERDLNTNLALNQDAQELIKLFYEKATNMHIDTDKGMYQIIGIFVPASLLVLGWALSKKAGEELSIEATITIGSLAVVLVGVATIIKHRLRYYNKMREIYMRWAEKILLHNKGLAEGKGMHCFMKNKDKSSCFVSFHFAIDFYYFAHLSVWVIIFMSRAGLI